MVVEAGEFFNNKAQQPSAGFKCRGHDDRADLILRDRLKSGS